MSTKEININNLLINDLKVKYFTLNICGMVFDSIQNVKDYIKPQH